jgi:endogenous inhibitor of DNA gyrase (YacG/DUF329 family)
MDERRDTSGHSPDRDMKQPDNEGAADRRPASGAGEWIERVCPICKKKFRVERSQVTDRSKTFYPFCSQRCRMVDLGRWLNADYRFSMPAEPSAEVLEDEEGETDPIE